MYSDAGVRERRRRVLSASFGEAVDFTYDDEQLALQDGGAHRARARVRAGPAAPAGRGPGRHHPRAVVDAGRPGLDRPAGARRSSAAPGPACSRRASCSSRWGASRCPGPFFSSAVAATLAARALGATELLGRPGLGHAPRHRRPGRAGARRAARHRAHARPAQGCAVGAAAARSRSSSTGTRADWAIVVARSEEGVRSYLLERVARPAAGAAELVPSLDPTRKLARLVLDDTPVVPLGPPGNQAGTVAAGAGRHRRGAGGRDGRRGRPGAGRGHRVHVGAGRLRQARGHLPDRAPPPGRDVPAGRDGPGRVPVRRLGLRHRGARARARRPPWPPATRPRPACG